MKRIPGITTLLFGIAAAVPAVAEPIELSWADLVPEEAIAAGGGLNILEGVVEHSQVTDLAEDASTPVADAGEVLGISVGTAFRTDLDETEVTIPGYLLPITFDGADVSEFLLVPFVGACVHVPPPPPNQLIFVTYERGYPVSSLFEPVTVTGQLTVRDVDTELAEVGYTIDAATVRHVR